MAPLELGLPLVTRAPLETLELVEVQVLQVQWYQQQQRYQVECPYRILLEQVQQ
jgi:hypothetical protein